MSDYYDWTGHPITPKKWAEMFEKERHVGKDEIAGYLVSTVWLGLDHQWEEGPPLIFETMVFDGGDMGKDVYTMRYATEDDAKQGHKLAMQMAARGDFNKKEESDD